MLMALFEDQNGPINLTNTTVSFLYRLKPNGPTITGSASVLNAVSGIAEYQWTENDVTNKGVYWCEWQARYPNGKTITFPNDSYITFEIMEDLD